ncbi:MAG: GIY-YIG nuclease family protein [Gemmatimonadaceae bacterium]
MDRKEMLREYKERRVPMGVYRVRCTVTSDSLVAASKDVNSLLNRHRAQLRTNGHPSRALQAAWNTHGADAFTFEVLEFLEPPEQPDYNPLDDLTILEEIWLEKLGMAPDKIHTIARQR